MEERFALETGEGRAVVSLAEERKSRAEEAFEFMKGLLSADKRKVSVRGINDSRAQAVYDAARDAVRAGVSHRRIKHQNI